MKLVTRTVKATNPWFGYDTWRWARVAEWYIRVKVFRKPRYLIDRWTIEEEIIE